MALVFISAVGVWAQSAASSTTGDIYSGGNINNLNIGEGSVVTAKGSIASGGSSTWQIPQYGINLWNVAKQKMNKNVKRLKLERSRILNIAKIEGVFNLNPVSGDYNDATISSNNPEGQIWSKSGNLEMGEAEFSGRGTIIVESGTVTITGNLSYKDTKSSLGIIADNIIIESAVTALIGAYYSPNTITFK